MRVVDVQSLISHRETLAEMITAITENEPGDPDVAVFQKRLDEVVLKLGRLSTSPGNAIAVQG